MPRIILRPSFSKDLDGLRRSARIAYQKASEVLVEIQRDIEPSVPRRAETRIPKCEKFQLTDSYRLVLQRGASGDTMVALVVGTHDHVDSFLDGHKGYVFDEKTGRLRELRLATATETTVEMVPSAELQAEDSELEVLNTTHQKRAQALELELKTLMKSRGEVPHLQKSSTL